MHIESSQDSKLGPDQFILILRDVTARKQTEQQRETSRNMLALGEMAAVLAHEIRNPLGSMELWTSVLDKQSTIGEEGKYCVEHLQAGIRSLSATVNNVLQFHGHGSAGHVRLNLKTVLQSGIAFIRPLAEQAGIKLAVNLEIDSVEIEGDPNGLQQVILNLAINAFRHTPTGGSLNISARLRDGIVIVDFADTGEGIAEQNLAKIFNAGFSGSNQTTGTRPHHLSANHGTTSRRDSGAKPRLQRDEVFAGVPHPMTPQPRSVLVVDDEPGMRMALKANFERDGWRVETASGAVEAVHKCEQTHFPLVVTDVSHARWRRIGTDATAESCRLIHRRDRADSIRYGSSSSPGHAKRRLRLPDQTIFLRAVAVNRGAGDAEFGRGTRFPGRPKQKLWEIRRR